ncbi:MAG: thioredoxin domain-containing protein [Alphaproteobacteria bacterium]|nr:thioredoxin domain-containing protein [Alphaproteobacteria bacterium]
MKKSLYISVLALIVSIATAACMMFCCCNHRSMQAAKPAAAALDVAELRTALENNPEMIINALQRYEQSQREAELQQAARLFKENIEELNNNASSPFVGPKDAKIVLVEFFDFSCGYCKRLAPAMEAIVAKNKDIKVVFKPITFVAPISKYAAQAAMAAHEQGKFMDLYKAMLGAEERLTEESINAMAEKAGVDMKKFKADVASSKVEDSISGVARLSEKLQIRGVPTLILNGTQIQVIDEAGIQAEIDRLK